MTHLAADRQVSALTQNQAKVAILCFYKQVLGVDWPWLDNVVQAKTPCGRGILSPLDALQSKKARYRAFGLMGGQRTVTVSAVVAPVLSQAPASP